PLVIGDRLDTDIQGGNAAGFDGAVVLTGVVGPKEIIEARADRRPAYILENLTGLHRTHAAPSHTDGHWRLGDVSAHVDQGELTVHGRERMKTISGQGAPARLSIEELKVAAVAA